MDAKRTQKIQKVADAMARDFRNIIGEYLPGCDHAEHHQEFAEAAAWALGVAFLTHIGLVRNDDLTTREAAMDSLATMYDTNAGELDAQIAKWRKADDMTFYASGAPVSGRQDAPDVVPGANMPGVAGGLPADLEKLSATDRIYAITIQNINTVLNMTLALPPDAPQEDIRLHAFAGGNGLAFSMLAWWASIKADEITLRDAVIKVIDSQIEIHGDAFEKIALHGRPVAGNA